MSEHLPIDAVPAEVYFLAVAPRAAGPEPLPESGGRRFLRAKYCVMTSALPTLNFVELIDVSADEVAEVAREVRDLLREQGRVQAAWAIANSAADMIEKVKGLGMTPYVDPPLQPSCTCMVMIEPPDQPRDARIVVREADSEADLVAAGELASSVFGIVGKDREGMLQSMRARHRLRQQGLPVMSTYLAYLDGALVGNAQATIAAAGMTLSGSCVAPAARGRGVYRSLISARWNEAVAQGRPALTVQAGEMSRPILERLGFRIVATQTVFCDKFG